ncbi:MAG: hypothetical protein O3C54_06230 [Proteobacteria bacterium]|nr:hypothetical protein [Pseudomonadota bacterium]MDA0843136.1 hypothetical protein [Bacteroidota bacterium]
METSPRINLFFTLFEAQLVRSYLESDKGEFFKNIASRYNLIVITNLDLSDYISQRLRLFNVHADVIPVDLTCFKESMLAKIAGFYLRWNDKSLTTRKKLHSSSWKSKHLIIKQTLRLILHYVIPLFLPVIGFFRKTYYYSIDVQGLLPAIRLPKDNNVSIVFLSSLTNYWEDVVCGAYFRSFGCKVVASTRSWDNLLSHGQLRFLPDIFLSHSKFMTDTAINHQGLREKTVLQWVTPTYRTQFIPAKFNKRMDTSHIIYASMGLASNPDDLNFIQRLIELNQRFSFDIDLSLLLHPKFNSHVDNIKLPGNFSRKTFQYDETSLSEYYDFLGSADLLICSGTTAGLDSCFLGKKVAIVGYEIIPQNRWTSGLRCLDLMPHTSQFYKRAGLPIINNEKELVALLTGTKEVGDYKTNVIQDFTGDPNTNFFEIFTSSLRHVS